MQIPRINKERILWPKTFLERLFSQPPEPQKEQIWHSKKDGDVMQVAYITKKQHQTMVSVYYPTCFVTFGGMGEPHQYSMTLDEWKEKIISEKRQLIT